MKEKGIQAIVAGVVILVLVQKIARAFAPSPASQAQDAIDVQTVHEAAIFTDVDAMPELWDGKILTNSLVSGALTTGQMNAYARPYTAAIGGAVVAYKSAKGYLWDNEAQAVSAVSIMPNWPSLLVMAEHFFNSYGTTLGAYGATFLELPDMARIAKIVSNLREEWTN